MTATLPGHTGLPRTAPIADFQARCLAGEWGVALNVGSHAALEGVLEQLQEILDSGLPADDRNEIYALGYYVECQRQEW